MKRIFFIFFLLSCSGSDGGSGAGSLGPLNAFEFIPDEADDWGEMMAEQYEDSLKEYADSLKWAREDSLEEVAGEQWIDSIAEDYYQRTGIDKRKNLLNK